MSEVLPIVFFIALGITSTAVLIGSWAGIIYLGMQAGTKDDELTPRREQQW